jgi:hypothetical protein
LAKRYAPTLGPCNVCYVRFGRFPWTTHSARNLIVFKQIEFFDHTGSGGLEPCDDAGCPAPHGRLKTALVTQKRVRILCRLCGPLRRYGGASVGLWSHVINPWQVMAGSASPNGSCTLRLEVLGALLPHRAQTSSPQPDPQTSGHARIDLSRSPFILRIAQASPGLGGSQLSQLMLLISKAAHEDTRFHTNEKLRR